jgi:hypothetical protein
MAIAKAKAMGRIQQPDVISDTTPVANLATGEVLDLGSAPPETLALALDTLRARQQLYKQWGSALEDELRRRLALRDRRSTVFGEWEVEAERARSEAVWDGDEVEAQLRALIDDGVISARECTGVVTHETVVHRAEINRLLGRLSDTARQSIEQFRSWQSSGRGKLRVTKSVPLIATPPEEQP